MPTPTKGPRLGGGPAHERLMLANLATALFVHGRITTTQAKAKRVRPLAERMITFAKRGDLASRRRVMTVIRDKSAVHELFTDIGPRFANRPGGYTRITKIEPRKGDNAPMAVIELVEALDESTTKKRATKKTPATASSKASAKPTDESTVVDEAVADDAVGEEAVVDPAGADEAAVGVGDPTVSEDVATTDTATDTGTDTAPRA